jgi:D-alanyl-D-alanine-carboxypeptidase/D-alanyl-D-alanine-endopeptidase
MRRGRRAGLVAGYLAGDQRRIAGYGCLGGGASRAPGATTLFEIGSVTKVFTVLLLADLAEQGVVGLGLPFAASAPVPAFQGRAIT